MTMKLEPEQEKVLYSATRTSLSLDRTLMSWVRTAASIIGFGITLYKFFDFLKHQGDQSAHPGLISPREYAILMISIANVTLIATTIQHIRIKRKINRRHPEIPGSMAVTLAFLVAAFGLMAMTAAILRL